MLQKRDKLVCSPGSEEYILMVSVRGLEADVLGVVKAEDIFERGLFEEPKVARYAHTKKALYFDSLKQAGISLDSI